MIDVLTAQARIRRWTRLLMVVMAVAVPAWAVLVYAVAVGMVWAFAYEFLPGREQRVAAIGWQWEVMVVLAAVVLAAVLVTATARRRRYGRSGGAAVVEMLGGKPIDPATRDPDERKLYEVVEQIAHEAGVAAPAVCVLANERGINALCIAPGDGEATLVATRGAIDHLDHDELRGVVAHEISHVVSGDARLNLDLLAMSDATMGIGGAGVLGMALYDWGHGHLSKPDAGGGVKLLSVLIMCLTAPALVLVFVPMVCTMPVAMPVFYLGERLYARLVHWREEVTDAAAVALTRDAPALARALKKVGGYPRRGRIKSERVSDLKHMLFVPTIRAGPRGPKPYRPSEARIRRLEPNWDGRYLEPEQVVKQ